MTTPTSEFDRFDQAPESQRGELVRFAQIKLRADRVFMEPGIQDPAARRVVTFDPATHNPNEAIDALHVTTTPLNPRYQIIERRMFIPSVEFDMLRESLHVHNLHLRDLDDAYAQVRWTSDRRLGKYTDRNGTERERTAMVVDYIFISIQECQAAADAFYAERRGGTPAAGTTPPAPPPSAAADPNNGAMGADGWTDTERAERGVLLAFLPAIAKDKDYAGFVAALAADARLSRYFKPTDPDVVEILTRLGLVVAPPAPGT